MLMTEKLHTEAFFRLNWVRSLQIFLMERSEIFDMFCLIRRFVFFGNQNENLLI